MNMPVRPEDMRRADFDWRRMAARQPAPVVGGSVAALQAASQAGMMMMFAWPMILAMPFFWAPPLFVLASSAMRRK